MFNLQPQCDILKETKSLVVSRDQQQTQTEAIVEALELNLDSLEKPIDSVYTLGKLPAKRVFFVDEEALKTRKEREKVAKKLTEIKDDAIMLLDTFSEADIAMFFEALTVAHYRFNTFKTDSKEDGAVFAYTATSKQKTHVQEGIVIGEAINHTRELINTPYNYLNAEKLASYAENLSSIDHVEATIYDKKACEAMNMGSFLGVNKGSTDEPRLIHLRFNGAPNDEDRATLIGKGVMFDTGGYSLKGVQSMPSMKMDMGGAATVLGAFEIIARLGYKTNVDLVIAATDNRIGDDAIVPDDVLTAADGTTIEIVSTDAEGRLTLADALWFAQKEGATRIIDVATLTGSVVGALGKTYTGAFTNNDAFLKTFTETCEQSQENIWHLPIHEDYREALKSQTADMKNSGGRLAGASVAAAFLNHFVKKDVPWIHLDVAGTAYDSKTGASGVLVKSIAKHFAA